MQLMWVAGPTASVRTISITTRKVLAGIGVSSLLLVLLGVLLHFIGFRLAIEASPSLARSIGGVATEVEQQQIEATYRDKLDKLRQSMSVTLQELRQLEALKNRLMDMATPINLREQLNKKDDPRGGPLVPLNTANKPAQPLAEDLSQAMEEFAETEASVKRLSQTWASQLDWVRALPTGLPVNKDFHVTSGFGVRTDPFTGQLAMHEGLDFVAAVGTPVLASAAGTVTRSARDASYGNVVEISHIEGFVTRYAHLNQRLVQEGQQVQRGQPIGQLGNTGRSTGPHLHFEVMSHDRVLNPMKVLMQANSQ